MRNPWVHRFAILTAVAAFLAVGAGAYLTGNIRPLPGPNAGPAPAAPGLRDLHLALAVLVALMTIALAFLVRTTAGWIALGAVVVEGGLGSFSPTLHAIVAPIWFSSVVAIVLESSAYRRRPPVPAQDVWPPLRSLAVLGPIFVVIQITLGAAFRHNEMGVVWHILDAGIVLLLIMVLGVCALRQFPEHPTLRPAAIWMLTITGVQVLLGFTVFMVILIVSQNNMTLIVSSMLHVMTGSLTLAATVAMWLELRRCDAVTIRSMTA